MSKVIKLFIEDPMTGLSVPNTGSPEEFIVLSFSDGYAHSIHPTLKAAQDWIRDRDEAVAERFFIKVLPATKPLQ